ncbi:Bacterial extracellular solute-binding, family 1 [Moorella glycerini]|uniref:ABC transporter-binding protein n=1 Tax=Neomoorella stamsii TaxID=1266720 RepID=A0A9X7J4P0_9FIRM|nr:MULTISPECIES: sugar ABC transporter substrate-binding protein [Moorella]PRR76253.1 putative ABC transporter-binding protein precursor [Moorella stamsii]CEP66563.1 Bacterial extracellular solute-binding, family 1 [Moorella glycerini]
MKPFRKRQLVYCLLAIVILIIMSFTLVACGSKTEAPTSSQQQGANKDLPFKGITLRVGVGSFAGEGVRMFIPEWEKKTGGKVEVVEFPFGELYQKLVSAFTSGVNAFDIVVCASPWMADFAVNGYIIPLDKYWDKKSDWDDVVPSQQALCMFDGKPYAIPLDGDNHMMFYRKDALENPEYQKKFKEKYGYDLRVPKTWKEYADIGKFFNGWDWVGDGKTHYGALEAMKPSDTSVYMLVNRALSYTDVKAVPGSLFFDPDTMEPQVNNPAWVRALTEYVDVKNYAPPDVLTYGGGEVRGYFAAGQSALLVEWSDPGQLANDPAKSVIKGKFGTALSPGSYELYNIKTKQWVKHSEVQYNPFLAWGGWVAAVTSTSKYPEAAFSFADWLDTKENSFKAVITPASARNPYRKSHFENVKGWEEAPIKYVNAKEYLDTIRAAFTQPTTTRDLGILFTGRYIEALDRNMQKAISGQLKPQQALDTCYNEWKQITQEVGLDIQKKLYREQNGLK